MFHVPQGGIKTEQVRCLQTRIVSWRSAIKRTLLIRIYIQLLLAEMSEGGLGERP